MLVAFQDRGLRGRERPRVSETRRWRDGEAERQNDTDAHAHTNARMCVHACMLFALRGAEITPRDEQVEKRGGHLARSQ
eukprot:15433813-Alexandrium_andersonii.AAC.1